MAPASLSSDAELLHATISYTLLRVSPNQSLQDVVVQMASFCSETISPESILLQDSTQAETSPQRCAWVVENGKLLGVISQADILRMLGQGRPLNQIQIRDGMTLPHLSLQKSELTHIPAVLHLFQHYRVLDIPIVDAADRLLGVLSQESVFGQLNPILLTELAQRQHLEVTLRNSERRYLSLAETAPVGIFRTDHQGHCIYVNERWSQIAGLSAEQAAGRGWTQAIHPQDRDRVLQQWGQSIANGVAFQLEYRLLRLDQDVVWVWGLAGAEIDAKGKVVGHIGTVLDITERKRVETARQNIEDQLHEAQAIAHIGSWEVDLRNQQFLYWSPETYRIFEFDPNLGLPSYASFIEVVHPRDRQQLAQYCYATDLTSTNTEFVHRLQFADGRIKYVQQRSRILADATGQLCRRLGTTQDITEQYQLELERLQTAQQLQLLNAALSDRVEQRTVELQRQESKLQEFFDNANDLILSLNLVTGRIEYVNRACRSVFGYIDTEINPLSLVDILHPEYLTPDLDRLAALQSPTPISLQALHVEQLSQSWITEHIINQPEKPVEQWTILDILNPLVLKQLLDERSSQLKQHYPLALRNLELKFLTQDQQSIILEGNISFQIQSGQIISAQGIFRDVSDRKAYEQHLHQTNLELARATRLKDEFLANMSHELRTPLNAVLGMADGLLEEVFGSLNPRQIHALNTIEQSGRHLLEVINDILDLSKAEAGMMKLDPSQCSVVSLCQTSLSFVKEIALKKQIDLQLHIPEPFHSMTIQVDELRMRQVLINLLSNAVKFTPEQGQVILAVRSHTLSLAPTATPVPLPCPSHLLFSVTDTGIGIAAEDQPKLFDSFYQIDSRLNRHYPGTGLGLALVKRFVELHDGSITVESQLGVGSCFTVCVPCQIQAGQQQTGQIQTGQIQAGQIQAGQPHLEAMSDLGTQPQVNSQPAASFPAERDQIFANCVILLVEDNPINVDSVTNYLQHFGCQIIHACHGKQALQRLEEHEIDLILMDIQMPEMDGFEATRRIRANPSWANIPIIALTALAMAGDLERCLQAGMNTYLTKPTKMRELVTTIQTLLPSSI